MLFFSTDLLSRLPHLAFPQLPALAAKPLMALGLNGPETRCPGCEVALMHCEAPRRPGNCEHLLREGLL